MRSNHKDQTRIAIHKDNFETIFTIHPSKSISRILDQFSMGFIFCCVLSTSHTATIIQINLTYFKQTAGESHSDAEDETNDLSWFVYQQ